MNEMIGLYFIDTSMYGVNSIDDVRVRYTKRDKECEFVNKWVLKCVCTFHN